MKSSMKHMREIKVNKSSGVHDVAYSLPPTDVFLWLWINDIMIVTMVIVVATLEKGCWFVNASYMGRSSQISTICPYLYQILRTCNVSWLPSSIQSRFHLCVRGGSVDLRRGYLF